MTHGSLFSGIGGFDLASEWMGWENKFHCEWNEFGQKVLKHYWPKSESYGDITKTDFTIWNGRIDIITGGFPCQPYSQAGKRLGKEDERHLWPEMLRAIREIQPRWVVGENVFGLVNWNDGMVFDEVQADLEAEGYEVQPYVLPAVAVNAPHRRDRIWFVAHRNGIGRDNGFDNGQERQVSHNEERNTKEGQPKRSERVGGIGALCGDGLASDTGGLRCGGRTEATGHDNPIGGRKLVSDIGHNGDEVWGEVARCGADVTNSHSIGLQGRMYENGGQRAIPKHYASALHSRAGRSDWENFPTQPPVRLRDDGLSRILDRYISEELYAEIGKTSEENRIKNLQEVWQIVSSEEVWEQIRRLYSLESKAVLLQTMQLYSPRTKRSDDLSSYRKEASKDLLRTLRNHGEFRRTPQGRELEKQRIEQYPNLVPQLPHEVALASKAFEKALVSFDSWWRTESVKALGNAIVPQVAYQIFKSIEAYEKIISQSA